MRGKEQQQKKNLPLFSFIYSLNFFQQNREKEQKFHTEYILERLEKQTHKHTQTHTHTDTHTHRHTHTQTHTHTLSHTHNR